MIIDTCNQGVDVIYKQRRLKCFVVDGYLCVCVFNNRSIANGVKLGTIFDGIEISSMEYS